MPRLTLIAKPRLAPLFLRAAGVFFLLLCLAGPGAGQTPSPTPQHSESRTAALRLKLDEVSRKLADAPATPIDTSALDPDTPPPYVDSLRRYEVTLRRLISLENVHSRLQMQLDSVTQELKNVTAEGLKEEKPYSVDLVDRLQSELDAASEERRSTELALTAAKTTEESENARLQKYEAFRRRLLDQLSSSPNDVEIRRQLENAEVAIEATKSALELSKAEIASTQLDIDVAKKKEELLELKLTLVQASFKFSDKTLELELQGLETARKKLTEQLAEYKKAEEVSRERLNDILTDEIDDSEQTLELDARQEWVDTHDLEQSLIGERLEFNVLRRDLWERRFLAHSGRAKGSYEEWKDATRGILVRLEKRREVLNSDLRLVRSQLAELLNNNEEGAVMERWREIRTQALASQQKALEETLNHHLETESLAKRLLAEFDLHENESTARERVSEVWSSLLGFWNIELYTLGDSAVTVGKLCVAISILLAGLTFVGRFTRFLYGRFLSMLPVRENVKSNLERLIRYVLILLLFLFSLHVVNIPLTIFKFLGGTLAIAVGFGATNILNNFISGLILMVERPVRTGDLIEVDDTLGVVEDIGARSTRVRIPTGIHVILPNSSLLENKVVNWTLQDHKIRAKVSVGVAYGSPTRQVIECITTAVSKVEMVNTSPPPIVTFDEFADSSLNFTVYFWVSVDSIMDRDRACTSVRLNIDDIFREHGINIPFPQRDLNFAEAVPVKLITPAEETESDPT